MPAWWVHSKWESRFAREHGLPESWVVLVDKLIDFPKQFKEEYITWVKGKRRYEPDKILGKPISRVMQCIYAKNIEVPRIDYLLSFMGSDWCTQRFSEKRRHTSRGCLEILRATADCIVGDGAGFLAELHVALDLASKLSLYEYEDADRFLKEIEYLGLSEKVKEFLKHNWQWIRADIARAKRR